MAQSRLTIVPCHLDEAKAFVGRHHRHHKPPLGGRFAIAVADETGIVRGVAIVGRPVARGADDGWTLEVTRVATDGCDNACSALYGAAWRAAKALGYRRLITYTLDTEPGISLNAAGWKKVGEVTGRSWTCPTRPRIDKHPTQGKFRWEVSDVGGDDENRPARRTADLLLSGRRERDAGEGDSLFGTRERDASAEDG